MVERALVEELSQSRVATPGVYLHQMPYPCYNQDKSVFLPSLSPLSFLSFTLSGLPLSHRYTRAMVWVLPLAMIFAWLFPVAMTIRGIVHEKELRLKEYMKMMGLGEGVLRGSWFITAAAILSVSVIIITFSLKVSGGCGSTGGCGSSGGHGSSSGCGFSVVVGYMCESPPAVFPRWAIFWSIQTVSSSSSTL